MLVPRGTAANVVSVADTLREDVQITGYSTFRISYRNRDANVALRVTELLVDECIVYYIKIRGDYIAREDARLTAYLKRQADHVETLRERLAAAQKRLVDSPVGARYLDEEKCAGA